MRIDFINTDEEHNQVLFKLGLLDDLEDWELYQKQEEILDIDIEDDILEKYWFKDGKPFKRIRTPKDFNEDDWK